MSKHYGFSVLRDEIVEEYAARAILYRHDRTGAELLSLISDDENKVFGAAFRTPPPAPQGRWPTVPSGKPECPHFAFPQALRV